MKVLLDTHAMLWWWTDPAQIPTATLALLSDPGTEILASAVSAYELAYKHQLGKLNLPTSLLTEFEEAVAAEHWTALPVNIAHSLLAGQLPLPHRDPFDRLLAAQAMLEKAVLITVDPVFATFSGLRTLWASAS
ncbi:type II toxin-antitoxin system VapC family toxin [soil metagenome]